jgi:Omp85 superfamily domain
MRTGLFFLMALAVLFGQHSYSQDRSEEYFKTDTIKSKKNIQALAIPVIFYTPETDLGFGGGLQLFFNNKRNIYNQRLSNLLATAVYTTKKQLLVDIKPQMYFLKGDYFLDGLFKYKIFPNSFWGIGDDTPEENIESYNMKTFIIKAAFLKRLPPDLNFGFEYNYEKDILLETEPEGQLAADTIPGSEGAIISGLSVIFNLDDRSDQFSPSSGQLIQFTGGFSSKAMGATYSYSKFILDVRKFIPLSEKFVLAGQIYLENTFGNVPFQTKAWLGGGERMRGYFRGRYIDDNMLILQTEIRHHFLPRFTWAVFAAVGDVAETPSRYLVNAKFSYGGGIRFQILKSTPTLVRLDLGINGEGGTGVYFGVNQAF